MRPGNVLKGLRNLPVAIGLVMTVACSSSDDEQPKVSVEEIRHVVQTSYGTRGTDMSWPKMPSDSVAHADNLLSKNYMFVLDASASMSERTCTDRRDKMEEAKSAIMAFGESLDADSNIGLLAFSGKDISIVLPLAKYSEAALKEALRAVRPDGSTPLADAMDIGFDALNSQAVKQLGNGQYNLVVVTDGAADRGQDVLGSVNRVVNTSPVVIHAIGFCIGSDHALNQHGLTRYVAASDGNTLRRGLKAVLAESPTFDPAAFQAVQ